MKIASLRLQNLGSLYGTWHIDFTDPAFDDNSIFAITGPTGAGKSTLLDGLCLALYGATPRLGKITKSSNQIMSRHSGSCFAEVEFSTNKGIFRCHWSHHRSRNKSHGELQQPRHEIVDAKTDTVLASRIREVATTVETVTGMDFERFTRSTLLAQGGFAAFLEACDDDRSPILEQITGTEIYSTLSIKVHELNLKEQTKLKECEQTLSGISLLSEEDEKRLQKEMANADRETENLTRDLDKLNMQHSWVQTLQRLESELASYRERIKNLTEEKKEHAPALLCLQSALAANKIEPLHQVLITLQSSARDAKCEQEELSKKKVLQETRRVELERGIQAAQTTLTECEQAKDQGLKLIRKTQKLDLTLYNSTRNLQKQELDHRAAAERLDSEQSLLQTLIQKRKKLLGTKDRLDAYLTEHHVDEQLLVELGIMEGVTVRLTEIQEQQNSLLKAKKELGRELHTFEDKESRLTKDLNNAKTKNAATSKALSRIAEETGQLQQGKNNDELLQQQFSTEKRHKKTGELILLMEQIKCWQEEQVANGKLQRETARKVLDLRRQQNAASELKEERRQGIVLLEKNILLLVRIQSLEKDRLQLDDNSPCPLCGSTTHPYAHEVIPESSLEEHQLHQAKKELDGLEKTISNLTSDLIRVEEKEATLAKEGVQRGESIQSNENLVAQLLAELDFPAPTTIDIPWLQKQNEELVILRQELQHILNSLNKLRKDEVLLAKQKDDAEREIQKLEIAVMEAQHHRRAAHRELQEVERRETEISGDMLRHSNELSKICLPFRTAKQKNDPPKLMLQNFHLRADCWKQKQSEEKELNASLIRINAEYEHKSKLCAKEDILLKEQKDACRVSEKEVHKLREQRFSLFGDKNVDDEELRLSLLVTESRKKVQQKLQEQATNSAELKAIRSLQQRVSKESEQQAIEIKRHNQQLLTAIEESPFNTVTEFLDAQKSAAERETLQQLQDTLQQREAELAALYKEKQEALALEQKKKLSESTEPLLKSLIREKEQLREKLQIQRISSREQLKRNSVDKERVSVQLATIARQKKKSSRWQQLHMLIGSADGKKFRNFAQGLTFELMVHHANCDLRHMNNRYILVRNTEKPLDLNVIDTYQADEIRSTKNLSGGESFLVSLALALGLSKMASRNVRVDSLFLDEGFGTLDENALESALDTLSRLREENKLIGVISHVRTLQERVPLQIQIIPGSGGRSRIAGPGVSKVVQ